MEQPHLLPKLQTALSCLYNTTPTNEQYRHEAHQFLLTFKSSNLRRLVVSRLQSQKDKSNNNISLEDDLQKHALESSSQTTGSIYLSCLALLLKQSSHSQGAKHSNSHERIFAAQTLNHRCRSIKLVEAYDVEAEDGLECGVARLVLAWEEKKRNGGVDGENWGEKSRVVLNAWVERYVPMLVHCCGGIGDDNGTASSLCHGGKLLAFVLERHSSSLLHGSDQEERGEERIKGNLTLLTLAVALYSSAFAECEEEHYQQQHNQPRTPWANAVVSELGAALSVTALRIRYRPTQSKHDTPSSEPGVPPLIDLLIHSIHMVGEAATVYFSQQHGTAQNLVESCHIHAIKRSIGACLTALPETVLLPPSTDRGEDNHRIPSIDRACLRAASLELRSEGTNMGMERMWMEMVNSELGENGKNKHDLTNLAVRLDDASALRLLECCESWARFVWVPLYIVDATVANLAVKYFFLEQNGAHQNTSIQYQKAQNAAFQYVISIFEGAAPTLTLEDILSATLGIAAGKANPNKKRQTSKSKKRQERRLQNAAITIDDHEAENTNGVDPSSLAEDELSRRKLSSCVAAAAVYGVSVKNGPPLRDESIGLRSAASSPSTSTHSICSTISILASSVLPYLLWLERNANESNNPGNQWWLELFSLILVSVRRLCQSSNRDIRALAYEPLMILHESLNSTPVVCLKMEQIAVDSVCECALALAASCAYPDGYFIDLTIDNDDELELERNDVRDVVRSVSSLESGNFGTAEQQSPSMLVLEHLVNTCNNVVKQSTSRSLLPPESVVHALSALAKPLNKLGKKYAHQPTQNECNILTTSLLALGNVCEGLNQLFPTLSMSQVLPVSRLALMGLASLSPLFSSLIEVRNSRAPVNETEKELLLVFEHTITVSLQHAIISSAKLPELAAESTLKTSRYDIRGTMRGPGGEDHVGCIALMRLSFENDNLAYSLLSINGSSLLHDIATLYQELKASEHSRHPKCDYGIGVCPISRRLVLRALSRLCMLQMNGRNDESGRNTLHRLLQVTMSELSSQKDLPITSDKLFRVCEATYDLASFSSFVVADLFNNSSDELKCVFECVLAGYSRLSFSAESDEWVEQWARLRGAAVCLLRTCFKQYVPENCVGVTTAVIRAECKAATCQCEQGPSSGSNLFNDNIIGEDMLHAGAFLIVIRDTLTQIGAKYEQGAEKPLSDLRRCIAILAGSAAFVIPLLLNNSSEANSHTDPRPAFAEAWFQTMTTLVSICRGSNLAADLATELVGGSLYCAVALIFIKDIGNKKSQPPEIQRGMSSDGPQTLAMMDFMTEALLLGPSILAAASSSFTAQFEITPAYQPEELGASIIAAALLRATSGALPPWAVELTPTLNKSLFTATGNKCDLFIQILKNSTTLECSGNLLAGRYFENVSCVHIDAFLSKTSEACKKGEWGKLKSVLKSACGGKKKESGFNLKPHYTSWECERL